MGKISNIVNGWKNVVFENPQAEALAKERAKICDTCEYASDAKNFDMHKGKIVELKGYCKDCGCPFKAKLRSINEKCNLGKW